MPLFRVQFRRDTTENWEKYNPILLEGEVGYEVTKTPNLILMKQGDGYLAADGKIYGTPWNDLPYCSGPVGPAPEHQWDGTILMFKQPNGIWGPGQDLVGPVPAHRWIGTALQFQTQTGAWGNLVDLQGTPGNANLLPATPTKIGGIIIGDGLNVNEQGCTSVDKEFIYGLGGNLQLNDEEWLIHTISWTAPAKGWYEITIWHGGWGGWWSTSLNRGMGGIGMAPKTYLTYFEQGEKVSAVIGAGGKGTVAAGDFPESVRGGITTFGDLPTAYDANHLRLNTPFLHAGATSSVTTYISGAGAGGANASSATAGAAQYYGAGGAVCHNTNTGVSVSDGYQGAVRIRRHDPAKAAGPLPELALFSTRRMATRAAAAPATVNLYDPNTGLGSVWKEGDAEQAMREKGLISEEAWLVQVKEKQATEYAAWLADPANDEERIEMLRAACEAKLAETDKLTLPDFPITEEQRQAILTYRQALRELNHQPGAPWDGGGEQTPWPAEPPFLAAILNREQPTDE